MRAQLRTPRTARPEARRSGAVRAAALLCATLAAAGCKDAVVPDLNNPSIEGVTTNPTRAQVQALASGIIIGNRAALGDQVRDLEILGRDAYNLDASDPRWISEMLINLDPGGFGSRHWSVRYRNVKGAEVLIASVATSEALTAAEQSATVGFAQTFKALDLLGVAETRDSLGFAVRAAATPSDTPPLVCRDAGLTAIAALLDSAQTALQAGGASFPFSLTSGFAGFNTPAAFVRFNRAIKARTEIYRARTEPAAYGRALAAVNASFIDPAASLDLGVYQVYSLASGDAANPLYQDPATANFRAHPSVRAQAEPGDRRVAAKIAAGANKVYQGVGSSDVFTRYADPTSPVPLVRNEELILLRAQANLGLGNLAAAQADINSIRVRSGGLAPRTYATSAAALDDLLRQKRYSLLFESGSRWIDARLYGRLSTLPVDIPGSHRVQGAFPVPQDEVLARGGAVACTAS